MLKPSSQSVHSVPMDLLIKHKVSQQDLINMNGKTLKPKQQNLKDLAFEMCTRANQHLNSARDLESKVSGEVRPIFAGSFACELFLSKMEAFDFDLMNQKMSSEFRVQFIISSYVINFSFSPIYKKSCYSGKYTPLNHALFL